GALDVGNGIGFMGMNEVRKLNGVPYEEDLQVVAHQVPVSVLGIELDRKTPGVPKGFRGMFSVDDGGKPYKDRRLFFGIGKDLGAGEFTDGIISHFSITFKISVRSGSPGMYHSLRDTLPVEMGHLLEKLVILHRCWPAVAYSTGVLIVINGMPLPGGQNIGAFLLLVLVIFHKFY